MTMNGNVEETQGNGDASKEPTEITYLWHMPNSHYGTRITHTYRDLEGKYKMDVLHEDNAFILHRMDGEGGFLHIIETFQSENRTLFEDRLVNNIAHYELRDANDFIHCKECGIGKHVSQGRIFTAAKIFLCDTCTGAEQ